MIVPLSVCTISLFLKHLHRISVLSHQATDFPTRLLSIKSQSRCLCGRGEFESSASDPPGSMICFHEALGRSHDAKGVFSASDHDRHCFGPFLPHCDMQEVQVKYICPRPPQGGEASQQEKHMNLRLSHEPQAAPVPASSC